MDQTLSESPGKLDNDCTFRITKEDVIRLCEGEFTAVQMEILALINSRPKQDISGMLADFDGITSISDNADLLLNDHEVANSFRLLCKRIAMMAATTAMWNGLTCGNLGLPTYIQVEVGEGEESEMLWITTDRLILYGLGRAKTSREAMLLIFGPEEVRPARLCGHEKSLCLWDITWDYETEGKTRRRCFDFAQVGAKHNEPSSGTCNYHIPVCQLAEYDSQKFTKGLPLAGIVMQVSPGTLSDSIADWL